MFDNSMLILRFVTSFVAVQFIALAGCLFLFKKHRDLRIWLAALAAALYLNCSYFFLFQQFELREQFRALIDYGLIYPFFTYMLLCIALAPLFALAGAVNGIGRIFSRLSAAARQASSGPACNVQRRTFLKTMTAGVALPVALPSLYGMYVGGAQQRIDTVDIRISDLPPELDGFTIAQVSDLHVGPFMNSTMLQRIVERINTMAPDMIAITGDIINWGSAYVDEAAQGLAGLRAEYGVYCVLGNHDFYCDTAELCAKLEKQGIQMLRNSWRDIRLENGGHLQVAGIDDPQVRWRREMHAPHLKKALKNAPAGPFRVLLSHRPSVFETAAQMGCALTLAGHTHAGQIISPFGNGRNWSFARLFYERDYGLFEIDNSYLYINRGLGVVGPPMRINCPREITSITLLRKGKLL